jgi:hypothetical protein
LFCTKFNTGVVRLSLNSYVARAVLLRGSPLKE